ncbi:outer membrane lipoprotein carrier protein LolA [bacterium]|nr:outer membrane lipoprotein carrier protein LolA [bacterium]
MKFIKILFILVFAVSSLFAADAPKEAPKNDGESIAAAILGQYNNLKSFSAKFDRVTTQNATGKKSHDNGTVMFIAPSDIRMDALMGGKMVEQIIVDSEKTSIINFEKKNVMVKKSSNEAAEYLAFLKGLNEVSKKFTIGDSTGTIEKAKKTGMVIKDGSKMLKLTPKTPNQQVKYIFITAINNEIDSVIIIDLMKNMTQFTFSDIKRNPALDKKDFKAVIPAGFEVTDF